MTQPAAIVALVAVAVVTAIIGARGVRVSRTPADFLVAARQVPPFLNASAISGEYLSAASFLGIAGLAMLEGLGALWYAVGYVAGYLVLLAAVAAPLRRFGAYTIPDFAEGRLGSPVLRRAATAMVLVISGFYLLPQLKGAGITLEVAFGGPYWIGVVVLGVVVTTGIASGGMKSITLVQAFQYWLKLTAIAIPAVALLLFFHHASFGSVQQTTAPIFGHRTDVVFPDAETISVHHAVTVQASGNVNGATRHGALRLTPGDYRVAAGTHLSFPAGSAAPRPAFGAGTRRPGVGLSPGPPGRGGRPPAGRHLRRRPGHRPRGHRPSPHPGALLHQPGRPRRPADHGRRDRPAVVLLRLPRPLRRPGRLEAPGSTSPARPTRWCSSCLGWSPPASPAPSSGPLVAAGAFAAFLSTSSGLLISMAGAVSHDILGRGVRAFRVAAVALGVVATALRAAGSRNLHQPPGRLGFRHRRVVLRAAAAVGNLVAPSDLGRGADGPGTRWRRCPRRRWSSPWSGWVNTAGRPCFWVSRPSGPCPWPSSPWCSAPSPPAGPCRPT